MRNWVSGSTRQPAKYARRGSARLPVAVGCAALLCASAVAVAASLPAAHSALPPPGRYTLQAPPSRLVIHLRKAGWFAALGDNHLIVARQMRGQARSAAAGAAPARWSGYITLPAAALRVADPRRSPRERAQVQDTMDGPSQLNITRFPDITWRLAAVGAAPGPGELVLRGQFTLHGVTRHETWRSHWALQGRRLHLWGQTVLLLTDFGIRPIHRALGAVQVRNRFLLAWDIWWRRDGSSLPRRGQK